jgi:hypothetical protein
MREGAPLPQQARIDIDTFHWPSIAPFLQRRGTAYRTLPPQV